MDDSLQELITTLTHKLDEYVRERRSQHATKADLAATELRIIKAIQSGGVSEEDKKGMDAALARLGAAVRKLGALDAEHPDPKLLPTNQSSGRST